MKFNPMYEAERLTLYLKRDGLEATIAIAKRMIKIYLAASLDMRIKCCSKMHRYRFTYIESAYSVRYILRTKYLEGVNNE